jgi:hypothetical protein
MRHRQMLKKLNYHLHFMLIITFACFAIKITVLLASIKKTDEIFKDWES